MISDRALMTHSAASRTVCATIAVLPAGLLLRANVATTPLVHACVRDSSGCTTTTYVNFFNTEEINAGNHTSKSA